MGSQFAPRVEASDAAPGGHGRAWATWSLADVRDAARLAEGRGWYTSLSSHFTLREEDERQCQAQQLKFDPSRWPWRLAGRPGGWPHINLQEAEALNWAVAARLKRPSEFGTKVLRIVMLVPSPNIVLDVTSLCIT